MILNYFCRKMSIQRGSGYMIGYWSKDSNTLTIHGYVTYHKASNTSKS